MTPRDPSQPGQVTARTSKRVAGMSEKERAEIARKLAGRRDAVGDPRQRRHAAETEACEAARAEASVRVATELQRTERRLDRIERYATKSRYQKGGSGPPSGRYARLLRRADRLERQLNSLR